MKNTAMKIGIFFIAGFATFLFLFSFSAARAETACTDSDGGADYDVKGTVVDKFGSRSDFCYASSNRVLEYYCDSNLGYAVGSLYDCQYGCEDGACKKKDSECADSDVSGSHPDGKDYFTKGTATDKNGSNTDMCFAFDNRLFEYYCDSLGYAKGEWVDCQYGCENAGACKQSSGSKISLISPNGGETWKPGQTRDITWKTAGYNEDDLVQISLSIVVDPKNNITSNSAIVKDVKNTGSYSWTLPSSTKEDPLLGPSSYYKVHVYAKKSSSSDYNEANDSSDRFFTITDSSSVCSPNWQCSAWSSCQNSKQTRTCTDSNNCGVNTDKPDENKKCGLACSPKWQCTDWSSCSEGKQTRTCTDSSNCGNNSGKPKEKQNCSAKSACTDSDGGKDYYVKGTVKSNSRAFLDTCYLNRKLREYYCGSDGKPKSELYTCPDGCAKGACQKNSSSASALLDSIRLGLSNIGQWMSSFLARKN